MADVEWTNAALRDFKNLDSIIAKRIKKKLDWICEHFQQIVPEPLSAEFKGMYKLRVGDWRIIYSVSGNRLRIQFIGHRREIYKLK